MSKMENILNQIKAAEDKITSIQNNTSALEAKKVNIEKQIAANHAKIRKIRFFLEQAQKTSEGTNQH